MKEHLLMRYKIYEYSAIKANKAITEKKKNKATSFMNRGAKSSNNVQKDKEYLFHACKI
jgi:hypothetical protein